VEKPSRIELIERADRAIATTKILMQQLAWAIDQRRLPRRVRTGRKLDGAAFAKTERTMAPVSEPDFDGFDANIAEAERVLKLARECGFSDLVGMIQKDIAATLLPDVTILLASTDGESRAWVAARRKQLGQMLGDDGRPSAFDDPDRPRAHKPAQQYCAALGERVVDPPDCAFSAANLIPPYPQPAAKVTEL
jgi:hypothetical protein